MFFSRNLSSHEINRGKVCAVCGEKIYFKTKSPHLYLISASIEKQIKELVDKRFSVTDNKFPKSICATCRITLSEHTDKNFKRPLPVMPQEFHNIIVSRKTRSNNSDDCDNCYICKTGTLKAHKKRPRGRGVQRNFSREKDLNSQMTLQSHQKKDQQNVSKICTICRGKIGKGIRHPCAQNRRVKLVRENNVIEVLQELPTASQDRIVGKVLKRKISDQKKTPSNERQNVQLTLTTMGRPTRLTVDPAKNKEVFFPVEYLQNFQANMTASGKDMKAITHLLRCGAGRKAVPKDISRKMSEKGKTLQDLYKEGEYEFDVVKGKKSEKAECNKQDTEEKQIDFDCEEQGEWEEEESVQSDQPSYKAKRPMIYTDASEMLDKVIDERGIVGNYMVKIYIDDGQGSLKMSMSVIPENYLKSEDEDFDELNDEPIRKRSRYKEGGRFGKKAPVTSVKRLILLCVVPQVKESYDNLKLLFELTQVNKIPFKFVSDFKVLLIVNGQQTATASYPCPFCFVSLKDLRKKNSFEFDLKTYGDLNKDYQKFCFLNKDKKKAALCRSTVNKPLFDENPDIKVLEKCVVPELHVMLGFVNHIFWYSLVPLVGRERALCWAKKLNVVSKGYHGEVFEGNQCRKLLKEAEKLLNPDIYDEVGYFKLVPYVEAFKAMNKIVSQCFSNKVKNKENLKKNIDDLKYHLGGIFVSHTLKIHVLLSHIIECLDYLYDYGLGVWSEQAGESIHQEFLKFWNRYKINSIHAQGYSRRLFNAVVEFSSQHV